MSENKEYELAIETLKKMSKEDVDKYVSEDLFDNGIVILNNNNRFFIKCDFCEGIEDTDLCSIMNCDLCKQRMCYNEAMFSNKTTCGNYCKLYGAYCNECIDKNNITFKDCNSCNDYMNRVNNYDSENNIFVVKPCSNDVKCTYGESKAMNFHCEICGTNICGTTKCECQKHTIFCEKCKKQICQKCGCLYCNKKRKSFL